MSRQVDAPPSRAPGVRVAAPVSGSEPPPTPRRPLRRAVLWVAPVVGLVTLFVAWEVYVRVADVRRLVLPTPSSILSHLADEPGFYWDQARITVQEAVSGFVLALGTALVIATFMAHSRFVERATLPVIVLVQSTPVVVLAPVFLNWFGLSRWPMIMVAAVFAFVPFVINAFTGLRSVDPSAYEVLLSVAASRWEIFWKLRVPHSLPYLFSAGRICVGLSLVGAVIGEMFAGGQGGLGYSARVAHARSLVDQLWGCIFVLAFIGVAFNLVLAAFEARVLRWHSSQTLRAPKR